MKNSEFSLICLALLLVSLWAIPHPADSEQYNAIKAARIGKVIEQEQRLPSGIMQALNFDQESRNGLLVPVDSTFTLALSGNDDSSTGAIPLPFTFDFYGSPQTEFYINNNGNISFGEPYSTYSSTGFPINEFPMFAAFWADVDTRPAASGKVYYKVEPGRVIVTWQQVGYYSNHTDKLNTFQIIFSDGTDPLIGIGNNIAFSYADMQWTTGDASGGSNGFGGTPATVGLNKGDGVHYALIGRFDHAGTDYNGPGGSPSGVSYLDNQLFTFSAQGMSLPPFFTGMPMQAVEMNVGQSIVLNIDAHSAQLDGYVNAIVQYDFTSGITATVIPGNPCQIELEIEGRLDNRGEHVITIIATDDNDPPLSRTATISVNITGELQDFLLVADYNSSAINLVDANTAQVYGPYLQGELGDTGLHDVVISSDGSFALISNFYNNRIYQIDLSDPLNPVVSGTYYLGFAAEDISLSRDDRFALVADGGNATMIAVLDLQSRTTVQVLNIAPHYAQGVELGPDGKVLVNDVTSGMVHQYILNQQSAVLSYSGISLPITNCLNVAIHPSGNFAIASRHTGSIEVLQLHPDNSISILQSINLTGAQSAIYSRDGSLAIIAEYGWESDVLSVYQVNTDGSLQWSNGYYLPRSSAAGFFGVDTVAITTDNGKVFVGSYASENLNPLCMVDLNTHNVSQLSVPSPTGICIGTQSIQAIFMAETTNFLDYTQVQFQNLSYGNPDSWLWNFGDGQSSVELNPVHIYDEPGFYTVTLTIYKGGLSDSFSMQIEALFEDEIHLTLANSPYYFASDFIVPESGSLLIDEGVQMVFWPGAGLKVYGSLTADGVTFKSDMMLNFSGLTIDSRSDNLVLNNCQILNAVLGLKIVNSSFSINNLEITKNLPYTEEAGMMIQGACNMIMTNIEINGYNPGIVFNNPDRTTSSPLLTNIRVRNSSSSSRTEGSGIKVMGAVALQLDDAELDDFSTGIDWNSSGQNLELATPLLTNIRVRNSSSSSRTAGTGIKIIGGGAIAVSNVEIDDYDTGIDWDAEAQTYAQSSPLLTNIRVRNSSSSSRNGSIGIVLKNMRNVTAQNDSIIGFSQGMIIDNSELAGSANPLLSNIRIRNSSSSSRTETYGIQLLGANNGSISDVEVLDSDNAIQIIGNEDARAVSNPLLSNIRVRNSSSSSRNPGRGILIQGAVNANLNNAVIEDYPIGMWYEGGNPSALANSNPLLTNIRVRNSSSSSREAYKGIVLKNLPAVQCSLLVIYPVIGNDRQANVLGSGIIIDDSNATIRTSTIWGLEHGLHLVGAADANFIKSIIWSAVDNQELTEPVFIESGVATVQQSNISYAAGVYDGVGNTDLNPRFVNPQQGNFYLKPRSPLVNTGVGALPFDFDVLADTYQKSFNPGWNMCGVPLLTQSGQNTPVAIFGEALAPFYVSPYYTSILQFNQNTMPQLGTVIFQNSTGYSVPAQVLPGVGYWVRNPNPYAANVGVYGIVDDEDYVMELQGVPSPTSGFFMLANPYDVPISLQNGGIELLGQVSPWLRLYNAQSNSMNTININDPACVIEPWSAVIFKANAATDQVIFSYPAQRNETPRITGTPALAGSRPGQASWEIMLKATIDNHESIVTMGTAKDALPGYDAMDVPELPFDPFPTAFNLSIQNPDWEYFPGGYRRDIKTNNESAWHWPLQLDLQNLLVDGRYSGNVELALLPNLKIPANHSFRLIDPQSGQIVDLLNQRMDIRLRIDATDLQDGSTPWLYSLILEARLETDSGSNPALAFGLSNYPNPFNPSTTFGFSMPKAGHVEMALYNLKGQRVRSLLSQDKDAGTHSVVWDGKDDRGQTCASGFYFCRISTPFGVINKKVLMMK